MSDPVEVPEVVQEQHLPLPEPDPTRPAGFAESSPVPAGVQAGGGEQIAGAFLRSAFFLALHERAAHPDDHPRRAVVCFWMDFVLRLVAALIVLTVGVIAAWKALAPLPWS